MRTSTMAGACGIPIRRESWEAVIAVVDGMASPFPGWENGRDLSAVASRGRRGEPLNRVYATTEGSGQGCPDRIDRASVSPRTPMAMVSTFLRRFHVSQLHKQQQVVSNLQDPADHKQPRLATGREQGAGKGRTGGGSEAARHRGEAGGCPPLRRRDQRHYRG